VNPNRPSSGAAVARAPAWARRASRGHAFCRGLLIAFTVPGCVLFSTSIGFGALARDSGFALGHALFLTAGVYALPAQVVLIDQLARGAALAAAAFAVTLTAIRLLPMTVTMIPLLRDEENPRWLEVLACHFIAVTAWIEGHRRLPHLPGHLRLAHFLGIGCGMATATSFGSITGFFLAGTVPPVLSAALLFMTPLYFLLSMLLTARTGPDLLAVALGCLLGPPLFLAMPGFDLLATGLLGGTAAYLAGRRRR
jgi:predicted branched-subunit amino acid permease